MPGDLTAPEVEVSRWAVPARITLALDAKGLFGPQVDESLGVREPTVDLWEAGVLLPDRGQIRALAALTGFAEAFFYELSPLPAGRIFVCERSRRPENALTVVEPGEIANPQCPSCGAVAWAVMASAGLTGPVLVDGPDIYGPLVMARIRASRRGRPGVWGVRPVAAGEPVDAQLRRRPHRCPSYIWVCPIPAGPGAVCGEPARLYPTGWACDRHRRAGSRLSCPENPRC